MKKLMMFAALAAVAGMTAGCFTSAVAFTKKTAPDGTVTESKVKIVGTGDKASQIAAEGMFADGAAEDLGAGVKNASATQQSTGIKETLEGMGSLLGGISALMARTQGVPITSVSTAASTATAISGDIDYSTDGFGGSPGAGREGVYGKPSCSRCQAYKAAHPDVQMIDIGVASNRADMWAALKLRGFTGASVDLPVVITDSGYTQRAQ